MVAQAPPLLFIYIIFNQSVIVIPPPSFPSLRLVPLPLKHIIAISITISTITPPPPHQPHPLLLRGPLTSRRPVPGPVPGRPSSILITTTSLLITVFLPHPSQPVQGGERHVPLRWRWCRQEEPSRLRRK